MKKLLFILFTFILVSTGCTQSQKTEHVVIETPYGNIVIRLYDETPLHRDNFIKLAKSGFYNETLFHRVIAGFMIQGGDPDSKDAPPDIALGHGGTDYKIDAEIIYPKYFHKKGALAAARQGDNVNPEKQSSGSQFYIVQGNVWSDEELDQMEQSYIYQQSQMIMRKYMTPHRETYMKLQQEGNNEGLQTLMEQVSEEASAEIEIIESYKISDELRQVYTSIGGTPHLDNAYTVFGEVVEGLGIIDKIASVETNSGDRPDKNIAINVKVVLK